MTHQQQTVTRRRDPWQGTILTAVGLYLLPLALLGLAFLFGNDLMIGAAFILAWGLHQIAGIVTGYLLGQRNLMTGGNLVMRAVRENDEMDVRKTGTFAKMFIEGLKVARSEQPGQIVDTDWQAVELPAFVPFGKGE